MSSKNAMRDTVEGDKDYSPAFLPANSIICHQKWVCVIDVEREIQEYKVSYSPAFLPANSIMISGPPG